MIKPPVLIVHGAGAKTTLEKTLQHKLPSCPNNPDSIIMTKLSMDNYSMTVYVLPSLAPPAYNKWLEWATCYMEKIAIRISENMH
jgi:hypothetical protein